MKNLFSLFCICLLTGLLSCGEKECPEDILGSYVGNDECGETFYQDKEVTLSKTGETYALSGWYDIEGLEKDGCALYKPSPFESFGERYVVSLFEDAIRIDQIDVSTGLDLCSYVGDR